jgi:hypothetical protein
VAQGVGPEFKSQFCQKKKKWTIFRISLKGGTGNWELWGKRWGGWDKGSSPLNYMFSY